VQKTDNTMNLKVLHCIFEHYWLLLYITQVYLIFFKLNMNYIVFVFLY